MAQTRLEKFGTIFTRMSWLLRNGALSEVDKPLWYSVYEAFPPKYEPRFDRVAADKPISEIFYEEDIIRARFHKSLTKPQAVNLLRGNNYQSQTQLFLNEYNNLRKSGVPKDIAYEQAQGIFMSISQSIKQDQKAENK